MNYPYAMLPGPWLWAMYLIYAVGVIALISTAPWRRLLVNENSHVYLGTCVGLMLLWTIKTDGIPGMEYHFLGATLLTLMVGWQLAIVGINIVMAGVVLSAGGDWQTFPVNALVMGFVPVLVSQLIYYYVDKKLPKNFFVYVFLSAFFGAALAVAVAILSASELLILSGVHGLKALALEFLPYTPLMMFPEAFITGMLITIFVVLRPSWVSTFDDNRYLKGK